LAILTIDLAFGLAAGLACFAANFTSCLAVLAGVACLAIDLAVCLAAYLTLAFACVLTGYLTGFAAYLADFAWLATGYSLDLYYPTSEIYPPSTTGTTWSWTIVGIIIAVAVIAIALVTVLALFRRR
jgi:hypothetical protein